jgi:hypothetical protein
MGAVIVLVAAAGVVVLLVIFALVAGIMGSPANRRAGDENEIHRGDPKWRGGHGPY